MDLVVCSTAIFAIKNVSDFKSNFGLQYSVSYANSNKSEFTWKGFWQNQKDQKKMNIKTKETKAFDWGSNELATIYT